MAMSPFHKQIRQGNIAKDLPTRLLQFQQLHAVLSALEILNGSKQNTADLQEYGELVMQRYNNYMNSELEAEDAAKTDLAFAEYPLSDIVDAYEKEDAGIQAKLDAVRNFAAQHIAQLVSREKGVEKLGGGQAENGELSLQGTLFVILDDQKNKKLDAADLSERILNGKLRIDETDKVLPVIKSAVLKMQEQLKTDWQTYEDSREKIPSLENVRDDFENLLKENKKIEYDTYPELHCALNLIRDDFNKDGGSKQLFLQMLGCMMSRGAQSDKVNAFTQRDYQQFKDIMAKSYAPNFEEEIDKILEIDDKCSAEKKESLRQEAFAKKSKELYYKFLGAVLAKRYEADPLFSKDEFMRSVDRYIAGLKKGENNFEELRLISEKELRTVKETKDETAEQQVISVHHDIPVAAALKICFDMHSEIHHPQKIAEFAAELKQAYPEVFADPLYKKRVRSDEEMALIGFGLRLFPDFGKAADAHDNKFLDKYRRKNRHIEAKQALTNRHKIMEIYDKYFPRDYNECERLQKEVLATVNDISNHTLPIGLLTHQGMEPEGVLQLIKKGAQVYIKAMSGREVSNACIFAADFSEKSFSDAVNKFALSSEIYQNLKKYNKPANGVISSAVVLNLRETKFINSVREFLNKMRQSPVRYLYGIFGGRS